MLSHNTSQVKIKHSVVQNQTNPSLEHPNRPVLKKQQQCSQVQHNTNINTKKKKISYNHKLFTDI